MDHYGGAVDNWNRELIMLSGSPWHLASSKRYLPGETEYPGNPLAHLFAENYPGRKLLLLVDKFEKAPWNAFSAALKGLRKEVEAGKLPSFGGVVCVGNSKLGELAKGRDSPFTTDKIFGQQQLNFTLEETREFSHLWRHQTLGITGRSCPWSHWRASRTHQFLRPLPC